MTAPVYVFLPFFRRGAAAAIDRQDGPRGAATVSLTLEQESVDIPITMHGPGDVTGIDRSLVRRFVPPPAARAAEPYLFASVELSLPDLPWMFTPVAPKDGRLRPWLALVVVRADASSIVTVASGLPRLELPDAAGELPDLEEAWAWAHVQLIGDPDRPLAAIASEQPERMAARLVCPRKLEPGVAWRACVVPAFAAGRAAGLGEPAPSQPLDHAWPSNVTGPVSLPVYLQWEFSTADDGDFETLARRLVPCELPDTVGKLPIDVHAPGGGVRGVEADVALDGALGAHAPPALPPEAAGTVEDLAHIVEAAPDPLVVSPPRYGVHDIDVDPRWRAVAGLGAAVVRQDQEDLVAASWDQLGEAREANRLLGWLRLARHVAIGLHRKHFAAMSAESLATISAPAHARMRLDPQATSTLRVTLRAQLQVPSATAPEARRALRPAGAVVRNRLHGLPVDVVVASWVPAAGLVTPETVLAALGNPPGLARMTFGQWTDAAIASTPRRDQYYIVDENGADVGFHPPIPPLLGVHSPDDPAFRAAARASLTAVAHAHELATRPRGTRVVVPLDRNQLLAALDPAPAFQAIVDDRITTPDPHDTLDPITGAPVFTRPVYRAVPPAYLLPGIQHVPMNSTSIVSPNPQFAQAFLAGMNHELRRELLWREFPCSRDAVFFTSFWGHEGALTVLLIRGDLVRRFPGLAISSVPAINGGPDLAPGHELAPLFRGGLEPDALFAAFALTRDQARERFFVLQALPSAPRFGLDASSTIPIASLTQRNDLAWTHMPAGTHAVVAGPLEQRVLVDGLEQATWGRTAADQAWLTLQLPVRLVVPGREMVPS